MEMFCKWSSDSGVHNLGIGKKVWPPINYLQKKICSLKLPLKIVSPHNVLHTCHITSVAFLIWYMTYLLLIIDYQLSLPSPITPLDFLAHSITFKVIHVRWKHGWEKDFSQISESFKQEHNFSKCNFRYDVL